MKEHPDAGDILKTGSIQTPIKPANKAHVKNPPPVRKISKCYFAASRLAKAL